MSKFFKVSNFMVLVALTLTACQNQPIKFELPPNDIWQLNTQQSTLSFVSTKNKSFTEEHSIEFQQGQLNDKRLFTALINLNSVDTMIPIRDQRLRDILFETEQHPTANIKAVIPDDLDLTINQNTTVPFVLDLHGIQKTYPTTVAIQKVNDQLVVVNYEPILVNAKDFQMDAAINQLTKIAGLQSINYEVLVDFKLTFEK